MKQSLLPNWRFVCFDPTHQSLACTGILDDILWYKELGFSTSPFHSHITKSVIGSYASLQNLIPVHFGSRKNNVWHYSSSLLERLDRLVIPVTGLPNSWSESRLWASRSAKNRLKSLSAWEKSVARRPNWRAEWMKSLRSSSVSLLFFDWDPPEARSCTEGAGVGGVADDEGTDDDDDEVVALVALGCSMVVILVVSKCRIIMLFVTARTRTLWDFRGNASSRLSYRVFTVYIEVFAHGLSLTDSSSPSYTSLFPPIPKCVVVSWIGRSVKHLFPSRIPFCFWFLWHEFSFWKGPSFSPLPHVSSVERKRGASSMFVDPLALILLCLVVLRQRLLALVGRIANEELGERGAVAPPTFSQLFFLSPSYPVVTVAPTASMEQCFACGT